MLTVFTLGYANASLTQLIKLLDVKDYYLFDIRFNPRSSIKGWNDYELKRALDWRYLHVKAFGNVNYRGSGPIKILDYPTGRTQIEVSTIPVVLMCGCRDFSTCHRKTVADLLIADGFTVQELSFDKPKPRASDPSHSQPALF
jgi:uncharacterized protein (DUF488 family)